MDISSISSTTITSIANSATRNGDAVAITMQKKAMDIQADAAMQLIASAASVQTSANASNGNLGANVNVKA